MDKEQQEQLEEALNLEIEKISSEEISEHIVADEYKLCHLAKRKTIETLKEVRDRLIAGESINLTKKSFK
jgi:histone H3/H4